MQTHSELLFASFIGSPQKICLCRGNQFCRKGSLNYIYCCKFSLVASTTYHRCTVWLLLLSKNLCSLFLNLISEPLLDFTLISSGFAFSSTSSNFFTKALKMNSESSKCLFWWSLCFQWQAGQEDVTTSVQMGNVVHPSVLVISFFFFFLHLLQRLEVISSQDLLRQNICEEMESLRLLRGVR